MQYVWKSEKGRRLLYGGTDPIGELIAYNADGGYSEDRITEIEPGIFEILRVFELGRQQLPRVTLDFAAFYGCRWAMIPGVSYNGNNWGKGLEPKGFIRDGVPWSFSYHRCAVPGATYSEGAAWSAALFGTADSGAAGFSCSLVPGEDRTVHRLIWPEEEKPFTYSSRDTWSEAYQAAVALDGDGTFTVKGYLVVAPVVTPKTAYRKLLDFAWERNYHKQTPWFSPEKIWALGLRYAKEVLFVEDRGYKGFSKGLTWLEGEWKLRPTNKYLAGWTGQNLLLANIMLYDYITGKNRDSLEMALATLDTWAKGARLEHGLIRCYYDYGLGDMTQFPEVQDACNLGEAAAGFLEAYRQLKECGMDRPEYKEAALGICDFAVRHQSGDGRFGKSWTNDGRCADPNGTIGCYLVEPLLMAYQETGEDRYLEAAERAYAFYIHELTSSGYTTAGALDTYCIDKESSIPLLAGGLLLYEITGKEDYVEYAERAAYYLATWQWHHTVQFPAGSPLQQMGYDTFGGTSVSVQHHHIDPYALTFVNAWLRLGELTGKEIWKERALAAWVNGTYALSDGNLVVYGRKRPAGSQDEGFYHTRWGFASKDGPFTFGGVSQWLVAWPGAFRLKVLKNLKDWKELP